MNALVDAVRANSVMLSANVHNNVLLIVIVKKLNAARLDIVVLDLFVDNVRHKNVLDGNQKEMYAIKIESVLAINVKRMLIILR